MKSHEFITERAVTPYKSSTIPDDKIAEMLQKFCSSALKLIKQPIWRGMSGGDKALFIDPYTGQRESEHTTNQYTELIDHSPYFEGWPKRSKSLICSTNRRKAVNHGNILYAIFPSDNAKIAVCPGRDMWDTDVDISVFKGHMSRTSIKDVNVFLSDDLGLEGSYEYMVRACESGQLDNKMKHILTRQYQDTFTSKDIIPYLQQAISPAKTGFTLCSIEDFDTKYFSDKEIWTDSPVIAVRADILLEISNDLSLGNTK